MSNDFASNRIPSVEIHGPAGPVRFVEGARIRWTDPCGIGGVTIEARIDGMLEGGLGLSCVGLDVAPNERLAQIADEVAASIRELRARLPPLPPFDRLAKASARQPDGMSGRGGKIIVTGDAFRWGVEHGLLVLEQLPDEGEWPGFGGGAGAGARRRHEREMAAALATWEGEGGAATP